MCRNLGVSRNALERWMAAEADSHDDDKIRMRQLEAEIKQLRREKEDLGGYGRNPKKSSGHLQSKPEKKYEIIRSNSEEAFCGEDVPGL